jgi:hypothetical protein
MIGRRMFQAGIGGLAVALLIGGIALAGGRTNSPSPASNAKDKSHYADLFVDQLAAKLGITPDRLRSAGTDAANAVIAQALKDGVITQQQATMLRKRIASGNFGGLGFGFGHFRFKGDRAGFAQIKTAALGAMATKLGMTNGALLESLRSGKTVADLAKAKGVSLASLGAAVADAVKPVLDRLVKNGALSQERATSILDALKAGRFFGHGFGRDGFKRAWKEAGDTAA